METPFSLPWLALWDHIRIQTMNRRLSILDSHHYERILNTNLLKCLDCTKYCATAQDTECFGTPSTYESYSSHVYSFQIVTHASMKVEIEISIYVHQLFKSIYHLMKYLFLLHYFKTMIIIVTSSSLTLIFPHLYCKYALHIFKMPGSLHDLGRLSQNVVFALSRNRKIPQGVNSLVTKRF